MTTFLNILFILVLINAVLLLFSVNRTNVKSKKAVKNSKPQSLPRIYPIELLSAEYKKAI
tara:strand:- start:716 stop:895 length:180 start_codon:yes stop_codon:yes gene_type:complete